MKKNECLSWEWKIPRLQKVFRIMKLTVFLLLLSVISVFASKSYSQTQVLNLDMKNSTVKEVLRNIEKQSEFVFMYSEKLIDVNREVSVTVKNKKISEVLDELFAGTEVSYRVKDHFVLLTTPEVSGSDLMAQQQKSVSGKVIDSGGQPLPGVTVVVKGTTQGTVTNADGDYSITNIPENATLVFSFVGMRTQEVVVGSQTNFNIILEQDVIGIEEVVAIGYGTMKKSDLTGAVVSANQETIRERPNLSVIQSLSGTLPGLNVGQVNESGGEPEISIRGRTSISGENAPLIIVDNVIFRGNLIDLNPFDIESVDILKDASSAAIYGSQAANGVVIITTAKKSRGIGKPIINFASSYSFHEPVKELGVESPDDFIKRMSDADIFNSRIEESGYITPNPGFNVTSRFRTPQQVNAYNNGIVTDWHGLLTNQNMYTQNHNISLSNQSDNSGYFISIGFTDQVGYMVNEAYNRWNARINIDNSITEWFDIGIQSFMTMSDYSGESVPTYLIYANHPYAPAYKEDGTFEENPDGHSINPLLIFDADDFDKRLNLFGNIYANIDIPFIKGLSFKTNFSTNYRTNSKYFFRTYENNFQGLASKSETIGNDWSNDNILSYKNTFNEIHRIDLTLVYGVEKRESSFTRATATSFINDELGYNRLQAGNSELQTANSGAWEESSLFNMARLFYGFKQKYLITGTIRRDGFSGFGQNNKFGIFPSLSAAWVITEENVMKDNFPWLDYLKLRTSYGSNGNRTIGRYQTLARVEGGYNYLDGSKTPVYTQVITSLASPNLKWETTTGINLGLDYSILQQRINGVIEYYNNNTKHLLYNVDIPGISRFEKFPDNLGKIHNHGLELSLTTLNINNKNFNWTSTLAFSRNRNELRELLGFDLDGDGKEDDLISEKLFIGQPLETIYDYQITGELWQFNEEIPMGADLGSHKIKDVNNDGKIDPDNDRIVIGYKDPSYRFSVDNKFKYKNWMLTIFINSVQGNNKYYLGEDDLRDFNTPNGDMLYTRAFPTGLDYWLPENTNAKYQKLRINVPTNLQATRYIPRSFVRLQDINLSYNFKSLILNRVNIQSFRIFFSGKNLATWTNWTGWDPESGEKISIDGRPVLKNYTLGIDVKF